MTVKEAGFVIKRNGKVILKVGAGVALTVAGIIGGCAPKAMAIRDTFKPIPARVEALECKTIDNARVIVEMRSQHDKDQAVSAERHDHIVKALDRLEKK